VIGFGLWGFIGGVPLVGVALMALGFLIMEIWVMVILLAERLRI
jgi:hypothetical protein